MKLLIIMAPENIGRDLEKFSLNSCETTFCNAFFAIEKRKDPADLFSFEVELQVLKNLTRSRTNYTSQLICSGEMPYYGYIVMPIVGKDIESLLASLRPKHGEHNTRFTLVTAVHVALGCLKGLEELHKIRFIHRDVKPQNFAIGRSPNSRTIYLLDFGLAREYAKLDGSHHRPRARVGFRGTVMYASVSALSNQEQSRRDDLWSWLFILLRITSGTLPWINLKHADNATYKDQIAAYAKSKYEAMSNPEKMFQDCPPEFYDIFILLKALDYYDKPDYAKITRILNACRNRECKNKPFPGLDWEREGNTRETAQGPRQLTLPNPPSFRDGEENVSLAYSQSKKRAGNEQWQSHCGCTDNLTAELFNFCYQHPLNPFLIGKKFSCRWLPYLKNLGLFEPMEYVQAKDLHHPAPAFVTAADKRFFDPAITLIVNFQSHFPRETLIVYDLGFTLEQADQIKTSCNVEYRKFPFEKLPGYVKNLKEYRFKFYIVAVSNILYSLCLFLVCYIKEGGH
ncbi:unnamed protein product [Soboliphyme baturini]|uniref:Protein kinase domain-containing protein n=1 Tax=Soboliphyme baturini TaxID=241478 RepID=A0A183IRZ4_9BILA|nr:unnamed protein product [Soboliphyme baturini]